jgi:hypothetical protein
VEGELHVCGRNHSIAKRENLYGYVAKKHRLGEALAKHLHLAVRGEIAGPRHPAKGARQAKGSEGSATACA